LGAASRQGEGWAGDEEGKGEGKGREGEVEGRESEGPKLLLNQGPSEHCYATGVHIYLLSLGYHQSVIPMKKPTGNLC